MLNSAYKPRALHFSVV